MLPTQEKFISAIGKHPSETLANINDICKYFIGFLEDSRKKSNERWKEANKNKKYDLISGILEVFKQVTEQIVWGFGNEEMITDMLLFKSMTDLEPNVLNYYRVIILEIFFYIYKDNESYRVKRLYETLNKLPYSELQEKAIYEINNSIVEIIKTDRDFSHFKRDNKIKRFTDHEPTADSPLYAHFLLFYLSHLVYFEDFLNYQSKNFRKGNFSELINRLVLEDKLMDFPLLTENQRTSIQVWLDKQEDYKAIKEHNKPYDFIEIPYKNKKDDIKDLFRFLYHSKINLITADEFEELFKFGFGYSISNKEKIKLKGGKNVLYGFIYYLSEKINIDVSSEDFAKFIIYNFLDFKSTIKTMKTNFKEVHYIKNKNKIESFISDYNKKKS